MLDKSKYAKKRFLEKIGSYNTFAPGQRFAYDKTFDPEVVLGLCDLISRFSDFALYLDTRLVYFHTFF